VQTAVTQGRLTVSRLAAHKKLPEEFLRSLGVCEAGRGLAIPYYGFDGKAVLCTRLRFALAAGDGSRWRRGASLEGYGLWRLSPFRGGGQLFVVEGESNCWTLWRHGLPALGLPGASTARQTLHRDALDGQGRLWVHVDPGRSGEEFLRGVCLALGFCRYRGEVLVIDSGAAKDPSDLHCQDPAAFAAAWQERMRAAAALPPEWWMGPRAGANLLGEALRDPPEWLRRRLLDVLADDVGRLVGELLRQRGGVARG
jgi:putative DNA primase/helicase